MHALSFIRILNEISSSVLVPLAPPLLPDVLRLFQTSSEHLDTSELVAVAVLLMELSAQLENDAVKVPLVLRQGVSQTLTEKGLNRQLLHNTTEKVFKLSIGEDAKYLLRAIPLLCGFARELDMEYVVLLRLCLETFLNRYLETIIVSLLFSYNT
jgi:hypothetical protein